MENENILKKFIVTYIDCDNKRKAMVASWFRDASCKDFKEYLEKHLDIVEIVNVYPVKEGNENK